MQMVIAILLLTGLCFGSFVNAFVWRLHKKKDWVNDRSICVHCKHVLAPQDLIPVVSWLLLRGKCRYCHKPISWQYPVVEAATAALFVLSYVVWPYDFGAAGMVRFGVWLIMLVGFMALVVYDLRWMLLPNKIVYPLTGLAAAQVVVLTVLQRNIQVAIGAALGLVVVGGLFYGLFQVSKGRWIGGGDVKLGFMLGLLVGGPAAGVLLLMVASSAGSLVSAPLLASGKVKRTTRVPFGPFLLLAGVAVQLFGPAILAWYTRVTLL